jgi:ribulose-5-phosphate 4-epimerase/fuculose-1-phosphate aldolase
MPGIAMHPPDPYSFRPDRFDEAEWRARVDLAACYRLAARNRWGDLIYTHLSLRLPGRADAFLINPFGLTFDEITASSLLVIDLDGRVIDGSGRAANPSGFAIHGAVHAARPDVECVIHLHAPWGVALCALPGGLQPSSQAAMRLHGRLGRHAYEGLALGADEQRRLVAALGQLDGLLLEHHGPLIVGRTVAEAFMLMHLLERAARAQLQTMAAAGGAAAGVPAALADLTYRQWVGDGSEWDGDVEWPALLRRAERLSPGFAA